jgi:uncharacterized protein YjhX (UPF0386 family)
MEYPEKMEYWQETQRKQKYPVETKTLVGNPEKTHNILKHHSTLLHHYIGGKKTPHIRDNSHPIHSLTDTKKQSLLHVNMDIKFNLQIKKKKNHNQKSFFLKYII